ncbi:DNA repair protein XRCC3 isoform X2 [Pleurodeles waltl]|uniref:DNA repair protein XRCC3 isoform X2 n=1 Tax=Pleurodeles waltl TaxID=8319 RepID=UPI00370989F6
MDWDQLDLNPKVIAAVKKARIKSAEDILKFSGPDLQRLTKLSNVDVQHLLVAVSAALQKPNVLTVFQMYHEKACFVAQHRRLSLGCSVLDSLLRGGLPVTGITELGGESAAGKTQIAIQLCLSVQYPCRYGGLEAGAVYICTEDVFPNKRLQQLIGLQHKLRTDVPLEVIKQRKFGDNIFIEHAADIVTDAVDNMSAGQSHVGILNKKVSPALGITWSNQLLMRLMVARTRSSEPDECAGEASQSCSGVVRTLEVVFAPHLPQSFCCYTINVEGVKGVEDKVGMS